MKRLCVLPLAMLLVRSLVHGGENPPLLSSSVVSAMAQEISGETAKRHLEFLARHHRMRGSRGFHLSAEYIAEQLRAYGLSEVQIERFPADGRTFYGAQKARPAWDAEFAELWELRRAGDEWVPHLRLASWDAMPVTLAQDSESADVTADLIDVGDGTSQGDYAGKDVAGKIVLAAAQPGAVARLAVERYGAVGIISYAQNQRTAWWGEDENLIRWGHLDSFSPTRTFAFMISLKQARAFQQRLRRGETIRLRATVGAGRRPGVYEVVTALIPGSDPARQSEEIAFSCHLDHQRPGANDNASGCVAILEVARALSRLIREGKISRPARSLRFIWPPEIEGTLALVNSRPDLIRRIKAVIHMDMVGGGQETKAIFHITRSPASLPSFVNDVAEAIGEFVNEQTAAFASTGSAALPLHAPEGGKEPLRAELAEFSLGSDHQVYTDGSIGIPAIYLNDWPDRYIHTNFDSPANIDPTKLKRAAFIGATSGYFLATVSAADAPAILTILQAHSLRRTATMLERRRGLTDDEATRLTRFHLWYERAVIDSMQRFFPIPPDVRAKAESFLTALAGLAGDATPPPTSSQEARVVYRRTSLIKGPLTAFGYDYLGDRLGEDRVGALRLLRFQGLRGSGSEYAYEVLNFVDGRRTVQEIRDAVSAVYGPIPLEVVLEYLRALSEIGVIEASS